MPTTSEFNNNVLTGQVCRRSLSGEINSKLPSVRSIGLRESTKGEGIFPWSRGIGSNVGSERVDVFSLPVRNSGGRKSRAEKLVTAEGGESVSLLAVMENYCWNNDIPHEEVPSYFWRMQVQEKHVTIALLESVFLDVEKWKVAKPKHRIVSVGVEGTWVDMWVDTGSPITLMSWKFYNKNRSKFKLLNITPATKYAGVSGSKLNFKGVVRLVVVLKSGKSMVLFAAVLESLAPEMLLGNYDIDANGLTVCAGGGVETTLVDSETVKAMLGSEQSVGVAAITSQEDGEHEWNGSGDSRVERRTGVSQEKASGSLGSATTGRQVGGDISAAGTEPIVGKEGTVIGQGKASGLLGSAITGRQVGGDISAVGAEPIVGQAGGDISKVSTEPVASGIIEVDPNDHQAVNVNKTNPVDNPRPCRNRSEGGFETSSKDSLETAEIQAFRLIEKDATVGSGKNHACLKGSGEVIDLHGLGKEPLPPDGNSTGFGASPENKPLEVLVAKRLVISSSSKCFSLAVQCPLLGTLSDGCIAMWEALEDKLPENLVVVDKCAMLDSDGTGWIRVARSNLSLESI